MLKIRLSRRGRRNRPSYRVVVAEARSHRDGKTVEEIGSYDPLSKKLSLKSDRVSYWEEKGAQTTEAVARLLKREVPVYHKRKKEKKVQAE